MYYISYVCVVSLSFVINLIFLFWLRHHLLGIHKPVEGILVFVTVIYVAWFVVRRVFPLKVVDGLTAMGCGASVRPNAIRQELGLLPVVADGRRPLWRPEGTLAAMV